MSRVGAVDCGTNSIRLLVADVETGAGDTDLGRTPQMRDVLRRMEIVRLGQGIDRTGIIAPEALERTLAVARDYARQCRELGVERVRFVATSAARDAANAGDFIEGVREVFADFAVAPQVISGDDEAALSFRGATGGLSRVNIAPPYLVVDIGGGSTELVRGTGQVDQTESVDVGSVRISERHLRSDPPTAQEIAAATRDVDDALDGAGRTVGLSGVAALVGVAGSITTITAHALRLHRYDSSAIHLSRLPVEQAMQACTDLLQMSRAERAALPFMHPGRVDVIGGGALIWRCIVERTAREAGISEVVTSEHDILDGVALSIA